MALKMLLATGVALALILLPEPVTTATGTMLGFGILASVFGVASGVI